MDRALAPRSQGRHGNPYPSLGVTLGPLSRGMQGRSRGIGDTPSRPEGLVQDGGWGQMPEGMPQELAAEIDQAIENRR